MKQRELLTRLRDNCQKCVKCLPGRMETQNTDSLSWLKARVFLVLSQLYPGQRPEIPHMFRETGFCSRSLFSSHFAFSISILMYTAARRPCVLRGFPGSWRCGLKLLVPPLGWRRVDTPWRHMVGPVGLTSSPPLTSAQQSHISPLKIEPSRPPGSCVHQNTYIEGKVGRKQGTRTQTGFPKHWAPSVGVPFSF